MLPYWFLFLIPAFAALQERGPRPGQRRTQLFVGAAFLLTVMIGFRFQVGGDWYNYLGYLYRSEYLSFGDVFTLRDPGYIFINWIVSRTVNEIWAVNLVCGLIFSVGLISFARIQPRPWLAILVAIPYLVIVVAMGYSRQAVAIGFAMLGLVALSRDRSNLKFVLWIALAATFHKTAVMLVPVAALAAQRGRVWTATWVSLATALFYYLFLQDSVETLVAGYIEAEYGSQGAAIRVTMNALPAAIFLLTRRRFRLPPGERQLWTNISLIALAFIVFLLVSPSSTAVDRMALYVIPLQIFVLSRLPEAFPENGRSSSFMKFAVLCYSAAVQFVWLNFASHADAWLPYRFYLFT